MKKLAVLVLFVPSLGWAGCAPNYVNGKWSFIFNKEYKTYFCSITNSKLLTRKTECSRFEDASVVKEPVQSSSSLLIYGADCLTTLALSVDGSNYQGIGVLNNFNRTIQMMLSNVESNNKQLIVMSR